MCGQLHCLDGWTPPKKNQGVRARKKRPAKSRRVKRVARSSPKKKPADVADGTNPFERFRRIVSSDAGAAE